MYSPQPPRISARVARRLVEHLAARGYAAEELCRDSGVSLLALRDLDARLSAELLERLAERAAELIGDPNIGLHVAQSIRDPGQHDTGVLLMLASESLGAAFQQLERYQRYWGDDGRLALIPLADGACLRYDVAYPTDNHRRHSDECAMADLVLGARVLTGREIAPRVVRFRHAAPADIQEHRALFAAPLEFRAAHTELELEHAVLELALPHANEAYRQIFQAQIEHVLSRLPDQSGFAESVRAAAQVALTVGDSSLASAARALGVSARTLQRKLHAQGTSFAEILDDLRRELAQTYLEQQRSVSEITWLLGYTESSAFHHAFKRWFGTTPEQVRTALGGPQAKH